jgi:hypothetical protein
LVKELIVREGTLTEPPDPEDEPPEPDPLELPELPPHAATARAVAERVATSETLRNKRTLHHP